MQANSHKEGHSAPPKIRSSYQNCSFEYVFSCEISYGIRELKERESLRNFLKISSVPTENEIYGILSKYEPEQFTDFVFELLNELCPKRKSESRGIIIDSTDINLNLNWHSKKITKESLENKEYKWGHSTHEDSLLA